MNNRFLFNAVVSSYYDIDTPEHYEEFEPKIYLENVDLFLDEIGIDYDRLLEAVQNQLKLEKPEISQIMQYFEDNSNSSSEEYVTIKPDKVLQCTGLKDKNGELIYEGDIVKIKSCDNSFIVKCVFEMNYGYGIDSPSFALVGVDGCNHHYSFSCDEKIIIGNIYEDSHLIENPNNLC